MIWTIIPVTVDVETNSMHCCFEKSQAGRGLRNAMYEQKHTAQEIADRYGVGRQVVLSPLKAHGVRTRGRWEY